MQVCQLHQQQLRSVGTAVSASTDPRGRKSGPVEQRPSASFRKTGCLNHAGIVDERQIIDPDHDEKTSGKFLLNLHLL